MTGNGFAKFLTNRFFSLFFYLPVPDLISGYTPRRHGKIYGDFPGLLMEETGNGPELRLRTNRSLTNALPHRQQIWHHWFTG